MSQRIGAVAVALAMALGATYALAKLPPPPPEDPAKKAAADEKKKQAAEKEKAELTAAEDRTLKNYQDNMRKLGKPIPKPIPVAAKSEPPKGGQPKPESNTTKVPQQVKQEAAKDAEKAQGKK